MNKPKIVILDAYPANPGDLSWDSLAKLGELTVHKHCPLDLDEVAVRCAGAEIVLTNKIPFPRAVLDRLPDLRFIAVQATGCNIIDLEYARKRGVTVSNVPGYSTDSVAQLVFALILEIYSAAAAQNHAVRAGEWTRSRDFTFYTVPLHELTGRTLGIVGFGAIGQTVGRIGAAFGMKVIYHSRSPRQTDFPAERVSPDTLFAESDIVTLHCPQTPETLRLVNAERLAQMKRSACLINTARGGLVDSAALADALNSGRLAGAGIDVLEQEPPPADHPLLHAKNCLLTPHVGWATFEARKRLIQILTENVRAWLAGEPIHVVN